MTRKTGLQSDEIGYWSEIKLDIIKEYAHAYSRILSNHRNPSFYHVYVDAFAGPGQHVSKTSGDLVPGSPSNALAVDPPFKEYHFIELAHRKADALRKHVDQRPNVHVYEGDCNAVLLDDIFPKVRWEDYRRALMLLDPYGLHLNWEVVWTAGKMRTIEVFLNFPVADMNRNVLWRNPEGVDERDIGRLNAYWGDASWRQAAYQSQPSFFGPVDMKTTNADVAQGFRTRLIEVAGFEHVPEPVPMRNTQGAVVYYLFFAAHRPVAASIVDDIFTKYRNRGIR